MEKALALLDDYCRETGFESVATSRIGYEDEGPVLDEWRRQTGPIKQLTVHCDTQGDWVSVGAHGDPA
jgi:hypothetical protein